MLELPRIAYMKDRPIKYFPVTTTEMPVSGLEPENPCVATLETGLDNFSIVTMFRSFFDPPAFVQRCEETSYPARELNTAFSEHKTIGGWMGWVRDEIALPVWMLCVNPLNPYDNRRGGIYSFLFVFHNPSTST